MGAADLRACADVRDRDLMERLFADEREEGFLYHHFSVFCASVRFHAASPFYNLMENVK